MNSILDHKWGVSKGVDSVWALVAGMAPSKVGKVSLMVLQAYIDESFDKDESVFVLGGYIAPVDTWAAFARDWEEILPYAGLKDESEQFYFKMSDLAARDKGIEKSQAFFRIIEKHRPLAITVKIVKRELDNAIARIIVPSSPPDFGMFRNPYFVSFRALIDKFHVAWTQEIVRTIIPEEGPVDFIFDDRSEKGAILSTWDAYISSRNSSVKNLYGATPVFFDEKKYMPLQAADFWVWWRRKWYQNNQEAFTFGQWEKKKGNPMFVMDIELTEDDLVVAFVDIVRWHLGPFVTILDRKTGKPI